MDLQALKYDSNGLIPAITQDLNGNVLMLAYMNEESIQKTLETGRVHYYSRSRQELWCKGETSGHFQYIKEISYDCDGDALLLRVEQVEAACHTGAYSCFHNSLFQGERQTEQQSATPKILETIYETVTDRQHNPKEGSYTNYLFEKGLDKMLKKIGEEASEVIIAAKNHSSEELRYETADLMYHLIVVLVQAGLSMEDIYAELQSRHGN